MEIFQTLAALVVAAVAVASFEEWKHQKQYDRVADAAAEIMYRVFELSESFIRARSPMDRFNADPADTESFKRIARERKAARLNEMIACWNKFVEAVSHVELWEDDFCKTNIDAMKSSVFNLTLVFPDYNEWEDKGWRDDPNMTELHRKWRGMLFGIPDDDFGKAFVQHVANVKAACKKLVR